MVKVLKRKSDLACFDNPKGKKSCGGRQLELQPILYGPRSSSAGLYGTVGVLPEVYSWQFIEFGGHETGMA